MLSTSGMDIGASKGINRLVSGLNEALSDL